MTKFSIFSNIESVNVNGKGQTPYGEVGLEGALNIIKNGYIPKVVILKKNGEEKEILNYSLKNKVEYLRTLDKKEEKTITTWKGVLVNNYELTKSQIPCISWNLNCPTGRRLDNEDTILTGYLYFDFDGIEMDIEEAKSYLISKYPFIKAIWKSCGGKGLGGIVSVNGISKDNFEGCFKYIESLLVGLDVACKDKTRLNVLSYDENILINDNCVSIEIEDVLNFIESNVEIKTKIQKTYNYSEIVYNETITNDSLEAHEISLNSTIKAVGEYKSGNRNNFRTRYCGMMNRFGVRFEEMMTLITKKYSDFDTQLAKNIYNTYKSQFNTLKIEKVENNSNLIAEEIVKEYTLKEGQYLSDLNIKFDDIKGKILVAPTGSGKTYFVSKIGVKKILLVPTQALTEQFANEYGATPYDQYNKLATNDDDFIVCTYASFKNLCTYIDLNLFNVIVDECHNFTTSANKGYMLDEMTSILNILKTKEQKSETFITATPIKSMEMFLQRETIEVKKEKYIPKKYTFVKAKDKNNFILNVMAQSKSNDGFFALFFNNTGNKRDIFQGVLNEYDVECFSSNEKQEDYFKELLKIGKFKENVDGIISTSVLKEGNNFYINNKKVYICVVGNFHPLEIEQFSARFRDAKEIVVYIVKSENFEDKRLYLDINKLGFELEEIGQLYAKTANLENKLKDVVSFSKGLYSASNLTTFIQQDLNEDWVVNYLEISNKIFETQTLYANLSERLFDKIFSVYNWVKVNTFEYSETLNIIEKKQIENFKEVKKEEKKQFELNIVNSFEPFSNEELLNKKINEEEKQIRYRLNYIYDFVKDVEKTKDIYLNNNSTQAFNRLTRQIKIKRILTDNRLKNRKDRKVIEKVYNSFEIGKSYLFSDAVLILKELLVKEFKKYDKNIEFILTDEKISNLLRDYFEVKTINKKENNLRNTYITIISKDIVKEFNVDTDKYLLEKESNNDNSKSILSLLDNKVGKIYMC